MSRVLRRVDILDVDGYDFVFLSGTNDDGRRVLAIQMRVSDTERYKPVIEIDTDFENFYKDTDSDIVRDDPIEPPDPR